MTAADTTKVRRALANFRAFVRRDGLTGWTTRNASGQFRHALREVVAIEDAAGIDAAGPFADRLTALRQEAQRVGLLDPEDVSRIEQEETA